MAENASTSENFLQDAAHVLDDIIDECAYEALGLEYQGVKLKRMTKAIIEVASECACEDLDLELLERRV
ncbi:hypothetical protein CR513_47642, partial [Mucuna pruriens]